MLQFHPKSIVILSLLYLSFVLLQNVCLAHVCSEPEPDCIFIAVAANEITCGNSLTRASWPFTWKLERSASEAQWTIDLISLYPHTAVRHQPRAWHTPRLSRTERDTREYKRPNSCTMQPSRANEDAFFSSLCIIIAFYAAHVNSCTLKSRIRPPNLSRNSRGSAWHKSNRGDNCVTYANREFFHIVYTAWQHQFPANKDNQFSPATIPSPTDDETRGRGHEERNRRWISSRETRKYDAEIRTVLLLVAGGILYIRT